jgi:hypothetical protein
MSRDQEQGARSVVGHVHGAGKMEHHGAPGAFHGICMDVAEGQGGNVHEIHGLRRACR